MSDSDAPEMPAKGGAATAPGGDAGARVHDLGYKRYEGERRPQSTRYRTIARKAVSSAWRGWWRMKMWVIAAGLTTFVIGTVMYVSEGLSNFMRGGQKLPWTDALLPMSFGFYSISAMILSLTVLAAIVADDLRTGAFEFYFSRPIRARDYVLGKLGGAVLIMGMVLFVGPVLLSLFRLGILGSSGEIASSLAIVPKAMLVGALATTVYAALPLAFSAISSRRRHTMAAWAAYYFIISNIFEVLARRTGIDDLSALSIDSAIQAVAFDLFEVSPMFEQAHLPSGWAGLAAIAGYVALSVAVLFWRVRAAERAGMGGG